MAAHKRKQYAPAAPSQTVSSGEMLGTSEDIRHVLHLIEKIAAVEDPVLIQGESGTGKDLVARAIHYASPRAEGMLVIFNCAVIYEGLLESEMFGHEKGAFTSADTSKPGLFEIAHGGTLFIDEIGEMALGFQAKLLRVLEDYRVRRVGATEWHRVNVRVIAATNKDLAKHVAARKFRDDLYYRLNVINISIPPLRDHPEDIPLLARHFLTLDPLRARDIDLDAMQALLRYPWPGNVRELKNVIRRIQFFSDGPRITLRDVPPEIVRPSSVDPTDATPPLSRPAKKSLEELEQQHIRRALESEQWNKSRAAKGLGISRHRLYRLMEKYKLTRGNSAGKYA